MSISNTWANTGLSSNQSLYRKLLRDDANTSSVGMPGIQLTIALTGANQTGRPEGQIDPSQSHRGPMMAVINAAGIGSPPSPPPAAKGFASDVAALFSALETGDTETATTLAERLSSVLETIDAMAGETATASTATTDTTSETTSDDASATTETADEASAPSFLTQLKSILAAVADNDFETATSEAAAISEKLSAMPLPQSGGAPPAPPAPGGVMRNVRDLLEAVQSGDTETASKIAAALREALPDLDTTETAAAGESFATDLAVLLNAVEADDATGAKSAADTIEAAMTKARGEAAATPVDSDGPIAASIDEALSSLENTSTDASSDNAFVENLKSLLEALKSGTDVDLRLQSVISAYTADQTPDA